MSDTEITTNEVVELERTRLAVKRTLMAWVRTALSMIIFGFAIYKVLEALQGQSTVPVPPPHGPRNVGLALIGIGTFAIIVACVQHWQYVKRLSPDQPYKPWDLTFIVASLIALLGLLMFGSILLGAGPFG